MINNTHNTTKQQGGNILRAKQMIAMLACFCLSTALISPSCSNRQKNGSHHLAKYTRLDNAPCNNTSDQDLLVEDYYDHNKCLSQGKCLLKKAVEGDQMAINTLLKGINVKTAYKPASIRVCIMKNIYNKEIISLMLEHFDKETLLADKKRKAQPVTLNIGSVDSPYRDQIELLPSYEEATGLPSYKETSEPDPYITLIKRLIAHKVDVNSWNRSGETVLTALILGGANKASIALFQLLLEAGANPKRLNAKGQAPLEIVNKIPNNENRQKIVNLLMQYGVNPLCASTNKASEKYIRNSTIDQPEKLDIYSISRKELANVDAKLHAFFNEKYSRPNLLLSGEEDGTCIVCYKKEKGPTTIKIPSCSHYVHGSCLVGSLINQSKGFIQWNFFPSYSYKHLCPYCKEVINDSFIQDLSKFYSGIKFSRKDITLAMHILLMIPLALSSLHYLTPLLLL